MEKSIKNYRYTINSTLDLKEVLDSIHKQLDLKEGELTYFEEPDKQITERLPIHELKEKTIETYNDEKWPSLECEEVEIGMDEDSITINSEYKLNLEEFDLI